MSTMPATRFHHLILLEPLGLLYGSSGRLLSPEALTGRANEHFPPDSPACAGVLAGQLTRAQVWDLHTAGPFWQHPDKGLMVPAPFTLLQEVEAGIRFSTRRLVWREGDADDALSPSGWRPSDGQEPPRKAPSGGWIALSDWPLVGLPGESIAIHANPWRAVPHLHPKLQDAQRVSAGDGALFLEYGIALEPGVALAYLSSHAVPEGVYRFGGEGHVVQLRHGAIPQALESLLRQPLATPFALITPGVWGGPKLSIREPIITRAGRGLYPWRPEGHPPGLLTDKPRPWRHRLGAGDGQPDAGGSPKRRRLARGRWAVPAGSCYRVRGKLLPPWLQWEEDWFPKEGFSFKQLGTALALPIPDPP